MEEADCSYFLYFRPESPDVENRMLCRLLQAGDGTLPVNQTGTILGELQYYEKTDPHLPRFRFC